VKRPAAHGHDQAASATASVPPTYSERLWPSAGFWLVVPLAGVGVALSLWPLGPAVALPAAVVVLTLCVAGLLQASPRILVTGGELWAGRAHIPVGLLGPVQGFVGEEARQERGPRLDARAFLVLRGWVDPVLRIELTDPQDPTPYWLVSTRHPDRLAAALHDARNQGHDQGHDEGTAPSG
jgi:hypothetical protein